MDGWINLISLKKMVAKWRLGTDGDLAGAKEEEEEEEGGRMVAGERSKEAK